MLLISRGGGSYSLNWKVGGNDKIQPLIFALPHHQESFDKSSRLTQTDLTLASPTNGRMIAYVGNVWKLKESEFSDTDFLPKGWETKLSDDDKSLISEQAKQDLALDFDTETTTNSTYFSGKRLAKFAALCLVINDVLKDQTLGKQCLDKLKVYIYLYIIYIFIFILLF